MIPAFAAAVAGVVLAAAALVARDRLEDRRLRRGFSKEAWRAARESVEQQEEDD